jgi:hypothetical protein
VRTLVVLADDAGDLWFTDPGQEEASVYGPVRVGTRQTGRVVHLGSGGFDGSLYGIAVDTDAGQPRWTVLKIVATSADKGE